MAAAFPLLQGRTQLFAVLLLLTALPYAAWGQTCGTTDKCGALTGVSGSPNNGVNSINKYLCVSTTSQTNCTAEVSTTSGNTGFRTDLTKANGAASQGSTQASTSATYVSCPNSL